MDSEAQKSYRSRAQSREAYGGQKVRSRQPELQHPQEAHVGGQLTASARAREYDSRSQQKQSQKQTPQMAKASSTQNLKKSSPKMPFPVAATFGTHRNSAEDCFFSLKTQKIRVSNPPLTQRKDPQKRIVKRASLEPGARQTPRHNNEAFLDARPASKLSTARTKAQANGGEQLRYRTQNSKGEDHHRIHQEHQERAEQYSNRKASLPVKAGEQKQLKVSKSGTLTSVATGSPARIKNGKVVVPAGSQFKGNALA